MLAGRVFSGSCTGGRLIEEFTQGILEAADASSGRCPIFFPEHTAHFKLQKKQEKAAFISYPSFRKLFKSFSQKRKFAGLYIIIKQRLEILKEEPV